MDSESRFLSLSLSAAPHNLKHLTYFMRSVRVCGDSYREAPAVITGAVLDQEFYKLW